MPIVLVILEYKDCQWVESRALELCASVCGLEVVFWKSSFESGATRIVLRREYVGFLRARLPMSANLCIEVSDVVAGVRVSISTLLSMLKLFAPGAWTSRLSVLSLP